MELMGKDAVLTALRELTGWDYRDDAVTKTFRPGSFRQGWRCSTASPTRPNSNSITRR